MKAAATKSAGKTRAIKPTATTGSEMEHIINTVRTASLALSYVARGCTETLAIAEVLDRLAADLITATAKGVST